MVVIRTRLKQVREEAILQSLLVERVELVGQTTGPEEEEEEPARSGLAPMVETEWVQASQVARETARARILERVPAAEGELTIQRRTEAQEPWDALDYVW